MWRAVCLFVALFLQIRLGLGQKSPCNDIKDGLLVIDENNKRLVTWKDGEYTCPGNQNCYLPIGTYSGCSDLKTLRIAQISVLMIVIGDQAFSGNYNLDRIEM
jgi:hypothetical protein